MNDRICKKISNRVQKWRVRWYLAMCSDRRHETDQMMLRQPLVIRGAGCVSAGAGKKVIFGCSDSPYYYCGYGYVEVRLPTAIIRIGGGTVFNNNCTLIANSTSIFIGKDCRIGYGCQFFDSDFHGLHPDERDIHLDELKDEPIIIGDNVLIGANVIVLKGATIGDGCVIGAGSVVTKSIPPMTVAAGNPCRIIRAITESDKLSNRLA